MEQSTLSLNAEICFIIAVHSTSQHISTSKQTNALRKRGGGRWGGGTMRFIHFNILYLYAYPVPENIFQTHIRGGWKVGLEGGEGAQCV